MLIQHVNTDIVNSIFWRIVWHRMKSNTLLWVSVAVSDSEQMVARNG